MAIHPAAGGYDGLLRPAYLFPGAAERKVPILFEDFLGQGDVRLPGILVTPRNAIALR